MSITGNLRTLEFSELLQWLAQGQKTGALVIVNGSAEKRVFFKDGRIISSQSNNPAEHLGTFMVREGLLDEETLARALKLQESTQILLGKVLVTLGTISEEELTSILQRKTEESLFELFNWTEGDFNFIPDELPKLPMVPIEIDVTNIVLEGAKRFDEARRDGKLGSGEYGNEIEEMLSSEIFHGIDLDEDKSSDPVEVNVVPSVTDPQKSLDTFDGPADLTPAEEPADIRAYYSGSGAKASNKPMLAAAAAVAAIAIGVGSYFVLRPDPAAGTADRAALERAVVTQPVTVTEDFDPPVEPNSYLDEPLESEANPVDTVAVPPTPDERATLQARYEAELRALKQQLQQAQLAVAERDDAIDKIAELEKQAEQARETPTQPEPAVAQNQFATAQFIEPLNGVTVSAGGDEEPPLGSPLPATEADQEAGTDFAAEMVESAPPSARPGAELRTIPAIEDVAEEPAIAEPVAEPAEPLIKSPVLLTRPKPRYPAAAMRLGKEAVINLRLLIGANGKVIDVERLGPDPGMGFSKAAVNAALVTRWEPATNDGEPIEMWTEMRIAFKP